MRDGVPGIGARFSCCWPLAWLVFCLWQLLLRQN